MWIIGSSLVYWAEKRAIQRLNNNLRLENIKVDITWTGIRGMHWRDLIPKVRQMLSVSQAGPPSMMILHLGSNDLVDRPCAELQEAIANDIQLLHQLCPKTVLVWSDVLCRLFWFGAGNLRAVERKRARINRKGRKVVRAFGGKIIHHTEISFDCPGLFRKDGTHLSDIGNDIFITDFQSALETFVKTNAIAF